MGQSLPCTHPSAFSSLFSGALVMLSLRVRLTTLLLGLLLASPQLVAPSDGDEVTLDDQAKKPITLDDQDETPISLGDFQCTSCPGQVVRAIGILEQNKSGEIKAGELWKFFHDQGVDSLDRLTLCLDVEQIEGEPYFDLQDVELKIENPNGNQSLLTDVSLRGKSLRVPTSSYKPEAKLEIFLNYDFMQYFSESSTEKITLKFTSSSEHADNAKFLIEADSNVFTTGNFVLLAGFIAFWTVVFVSLNRLTKPSAPESSRDVESPSGKHPAPKPPKRALSA